MASQLAFLEKHLRFLVDSPPSQVALDSAKAVVEPRGWNVARSAYEAVVVVEKGVVGAVAAANAERDVVVYSTFQLALEIPVASYDPESVSAQTSLASASVEESVESLVPWVDSTRLHQLRGMVIDSDSVLVRQWCRTT